MTKFEVTTITSRGQVVIPQAIREDLRISPGNKFVVIGTGDTIILKKMEMPSMGDLKKLLARTRSETRKKGVKPSATAKAINGVRKN